MGLIYVQCILGNFQYGSVHILYACQHLYFEGIWSNYLDIQQKNMHVRITTI